MKICRTIYSNQVIQRQVHIKTQMQLIELSSLEVLHWQQNICPSFWYSYGTREGNTQKELLQLEELKNEIC